MLIYNIDIEYYIYRIVKPFFHYRKAASTRIRPVGILNGYGSSVMSQLMICFYYACS